MKKTEKKYLFTGCFTLNYHKAKAKIKTFFKKKPVIVILDLMTKHFIIPSTIINKWYIGSGDSCRDFVGFFCALYTGEGPVESYQFLHDWAFHVELIEVCSAYAPCLDDYY